MSRTCQTLAEADYRPRANLDQQISQHPADPNFASFFRRYWGWIHVGQRSPDTDVIDTYLNRGEVCDAIEDGDGTAGKQDGRILPQDFAAMQAFVTAAPTHPALPTGNALLDRLGNGDVLIFNDDLLFRIPMARMIAGLIYDSDSKTAFNPAFDAQACADAIAELEKAARLLRTNAINIDIAAQRRAGAPGNRPFGRRVRIPGIVIMGGT